MKPKKPSKRRQKYNTNIVHPYASTEKTDKPLSEILKPTKVPFKVSSIINGSPR